MRVIQCQRLVSPTTANLVIVYANRSRTATIPAMEAMLITLPSFRSSIAGTNALQQLKTPRTFTW
jgi:hypothetical protein